MFSKQYTLSTKYAFSFVLSGLALVLSSVIKFCDGELISWISFTFSMVGFIFAVVGAKLKYDDYDEMAEQHLNMAAFDTIRYVTIGFILLNLVLKAFEVMHRMYGYQMLEIQLDQKMTIMIIGLIFMFLGIHFIRYEKYGEEE